MAHMCACGGVWDKMQMDSIVQGDEFIFGTQKGPYSLVYLTRVIILDCLEFSDYNLLATCVP